MCPMWFRCLCECIKKGKLRISECELYIENKDVSCGDRSWFITNQSRTIYVYVCTGCVWYSIFIMFYLLCKNIYLLVLGGYN